MIQKLFFLCRQRLASGRVIDFIMLFDCGTGGCGQADGGRVAFIICGSHLVIGTGDCHLFKYN